MKPVFSSLELIGVKPNKAKQFATKGIYTIGDLLQYLPRKYNDFRNITGILPHDQVSIFRARVMTGKRVAGNGKNFLIAECKEEESGNMITVRWFNANWMYSQIYKLAEGHTKVIIVGRVDFNEKYGYGMSQPEVFEPCEESLKIYPIYKSISGMSKSYLYDTIADALRVGAADSEILPRDIVQSSSELPMPLALRYIHAPNTMEEVEQGRNRILLNDLLYFAIHNELNSKEISAGSQYNIKSTSMARKIIDALPFSLTVDQDSAIKAMIEHASAGRRINALVQGDVGCGKTIVCTIVSSAFIDSGYQAVIMAPTQVLARQHYESISSMLQPYGVQVVYLDSSLKKKERSEVLDQISSGKAKLIIGTHACMGKDVIYHDLALTVVDEEHRFGVKQRANIIEKAAKGVHSITMSATPIPRSLAQVVYGDTVQLHTIKSMPDGRKQVKTRVFKNALGNMKFIAKEVSAGHQVYVVCPLIEESDKSQGIKSVETVFAEYKKLLGPGGAALEIIKNENPSLFTSGLRIASLTGKTSKEETETIIESFKYGKIDILIATTVIEVGVNVPNATVMIITNAERFGLSSLHQLRGRVGRSNLQSYCILQSEDETDKGLARLQVMCDTTDGFTIAEADLKQRGAGDLLGTQQSGDNKYMSLMIANPEKYQKAVRIAKELINRGWDCCPLMQSIYEERISNG